MDEYTTEVFAVGLHGFAPVDDEKLGAMAAEGWEPLQMTPVHNGFAALVLFRREATGAPRPSKPVPKPAPAAKSSKAAKKAAPAKSKAAPAAKGRAAGGTTRVRRARPPS
ncbi:MAG TPA: hypothetical protein VFJ85_09090 [Acidimicrobiales bacterium]|nr:hypothetical protein [Acidimicrobiales bacterium]